MAEQVFGEITRGETFRREESRKLWSAMIAPARRGRVHESEGASDVYHAYNPYPTLETPLACRYSISISIANLQTN